MQWRVITLKKLLNTLYVTTENTYLSLDGGNIVATVDGTQTGRLPLHTLESIIVFGYIGASPALIGMAMELNIPITFLKPSGHFLGRVSGKAYGNILLRREQYRICDNTEKSLAIARVMIAAKIKNSSAVVNRAIRDYRLRLDEEKLSVAVDSLNSFAVSALNAESADSLRGLEGESATVYFNVFDDMILQQKEDFCYLSRTRRPPLDPVNALLSFTYSLLTSMCVNALETVGLDPYAGFLHTERPGRCSLALDLVEEFRACFADRFVLSIINRKMICSDDFIEKENGSILLRDESQREFLKILQNKKREVLTHPFLNEKVEWGMLPYLQAKLLAKFIRGDIEQYPPFFWK